MDIRILTIGENNPEIANIYHNIGSLYKKQKKYNKALEYYFKCLKIEIKSLPENDS